MPYISMFYGIIIRMYYKEHSPPHFHAVYQGQKASFDFSGNIIEGKFSHNTAKKLVKQWAKINKTELEKNWEFGLIHKTFNKIKPLD
jgi:hypothetical protein